MCVVKNKTFWLDVTVRRPQQATVQESL